MGEVIYLDDYREKAAAPTRDDLTKRLAEIAVEKLVLQSEENRLKSILFAGGPRPV